MMDIYYNILLKNIPCFGIELTQYAAGIAESKGVQTRTEFFTEDYKTIREEYKNGIDLIIANNVVATSPM